MTTICGQCKFAKGLGKGLTMSPGDEPNDAIFCTNLAFLRKSGYDAQRHPEFGYGALLYRVEKVDGGGVCESGVEIWDPTDCLEFTNCGKIKAYYSGKLDYLKFDCGPECSDCRVVIEDE